MDKRIVPLKQFHQTVVCPPDKSITHRAVLLSAFSAGKVKIHNALLGEDCMSTMECVAKLGTKVTRSGDTVTVEGTESVQSADLFVGNSGTTMRLLAGLLAGQNGKRFTLDGDASIRTRPMGRVTEPLSLMGAEIFSENGKAPLKINGVKLKGISYDSPVASAQVKSAVLLAGLRAHGETFVTEPVKSRDHTERMLRFFGADIACDGLRVKIKPSVIKPQSLEVVGDISSAAYPLLLAAARKGGRVTVKHVGVNPTRDGVLRVLKACGANFRIYNERAEFEPFADIDLEYSTLKPFVITKDLVPLLVDELPALAVLACFIEGESVISGAGELKVKESNRIDTVVNNLKSMGADIEARPDGMVIRGKGVLKGGAEIETKGDHRIAMSMAIAGALSQDGCTIKAAECADISYPGFYRLLEDDRR